MFPDKMPIFPDENTGRIWNLRDDDFKTLPGTSGKFLI
jgi:hypothetical protein